MQTKPSDQERLLLLIRSLAAGSLHATELKSRAGDCAVLRLHPDGEEERILKLWNRPGPAGLLRGWLGSTPLQKELAGLDLLASAGVRVPRALAASSEIAGLGLPYTQALLLEDLGPCRMAIEYVGDLLKNGRDEECQAFLDDCIDMTRRLVDARIIDQDHHFMNIVASPRGEAVRLDLELAHQYPGPLPMAEYGEMLGRLIGTFSYAVQPDGEEAVQCFAQALVEVLDPPPGVLDVASIQFDIMREAEIRDNAIEMRVRMPWMTS